MANLSVKCVELEVAKGATIDSCIREAIVFAFSEKRICRFEHNDTVYRVDPDDIVNLLYNSNVFSDIKEK